MHEKPKLNIIEIGKSAIQQEIITLQRVYNTLSDTFAKAVHTIHASQGKVIITGMGKSAIIGQKIVATLNSTGTHSVFMHAADAAHGDLGIIASGDILIILSKSGETEEIKTLIPLVQSLDITTIALVSASDSFLARVSDITIEIPVDEEADPHNLAPTASTTAQLAVGDAIAIALLSLNGFTPDQFAQLHPGGNLGKKLHLRVGDVLASDTCPNINEDQNLREIIIEITSHRMGATAVLDRDKKLIGIITDGDLRRMLEKKKDITHLKARDIMTQSPKTISVGELAINALHKMRKYSITQLMVMNDQEQYCGVIHIHDLIREGIV